MQAQGGGAGAGAGGDQNYTSFPAVKTEELLSVCLLYTSDAADE